MPSRNVAAEAEAALSSLVDHNRTRGCQLLALQYTPSNYKISNDCQIAPLTPEPRQIAASPVQQMPPSRQQRPLRTVRLAVMFLVVASLVVGRGHAQEFPHLGHLHQCVAMFG